MPVYEYRCEECGEKFELFVRSATQRATPTCPRCQSQHVHKSISLFGVGVAGGDKVVTSSCGPSL